MVLCVMENSEKRWNSHSAKRVRLELLMREAEAAAIEEASITCCNCSKMGTLWGPERVEDRERLHRNGGISARPSSKGGS